MKKLFTILNRIFHKNEVIDLFPSQEKNNAELGGNYCSDCC